MGLHNTLVDAYLPRLHFKVGQHLGKLGRYPLWKIHRYLGPQADPSHWRVLFIKAASLVVLYLLLCHDQHGIQNGFQG